MKVRIELPMLSILALALGAEDRAADRAGQQAFRHLEIVGTRRVEADRGGDPVCEQAEATRD